MMSFDVFGTLISVRDSSYGAFESILADSGARHLDVKAFWEHWEQRNIAHYWQPYRSYREICELSLAETFAHFGVTGDCRLIDRYFEAFPSFLLYDDVVRTLDLLSARYKLAVVSNIDDDLLAVTPLRRNFDLVCTAQRAKGYKPDGTLFRYLIDKSAWQGRDPARRPIAIHRPRRRQAAGTDHCLDQPPRGRARHFGSAAGFHFSGCAIPGRSCRALRRRD